MGLNGKLQIEPAPRRTVKLAMAGLLAGTSTLAAAQEVPIVQPGAPGQESRLLSAEEASRLADTSYAPADVTFLQDMIVHHQQAVEMARLVRDRTNREEIVALAGRIEASQADEIAFMEGWLRERGEPVRRMHHAGHHGDGEGEHGAHHAMMGMATKEQMEALAAASGTEFDRQFLTLMIRHHQGALDMVEELFALPGTAADPVLFDFANEVTSDQTAEIDRMDAILASLSVDPRAGLKPGFADAGEAILNLRKLALLPKPAGFFDPANPAELRPPKGGEEDGEDQSAAGTDGPADSGEGTPLRAEEDSLTEFAERSPLLDFGNTDMAFSGEVMAVGNYHGFNLYKLDGDGIPQLHASVVCPGGQGDVSIVGDILIMSVEQTRGRVDCGLQGVVGDASPERFRGLRIFDISDLRNPRQVGLVQTCRGSHTHSVVSADDTRIVVYNSGTSSVRDEAELAGCVGEVPGDDRTALFRIDVIEIPLADPSRARIVKSPAVFADPQTGRLAGLWQGGDHGEGTQKTSRTDQCHDITVFPSKQIAAGACSGNGILFDISDPLNPTRIDEVVDKGFAYWHSATFNNAGTKVLFTDEWGGGGRPRCRASDPKDWGANAIYDIVDGELEYRGTYKLPAPQGEKENCVAHNGSIIPVPGRDIFVQAWYQGGISVIDFTDSTRPFEIAYFDRGPIDAEQMVVGGYWSAYWYNGRIYASEITRGLDVFALEPSEFLSAEEIAAAEAARYPGDVFNPQTQTQVTWSAEVLEMVQEGRTGG